MVCPLDVGKTMALAGVLEVLGTNLPCRQPDARTGDVDPVARVVGPGERRLRAVLNRIGAAPPGADRCLRTRRENDTEAGAGADGGAVERVGPIADGEPCATAVHQYLVVLPGVRKTAAVDQLAAPRNRVGCNRDFQLAWPGGWRGGRRRCGRGAWRRCRSRRRCRCRCRCGRRSRCWSSHLGWCCGRGLHAATRARAKCGKQGKCQGMSTYPIGHASDGSKSRTGAAQSVPYTRRVPA